MQIYTKKAWHKLAVRRKGARSLLLLEHSRAFWAIPSSLGLGLETHAAEVEPFDRAVLVVTPGEAE